ncbi:MAG: FAD-dependent oxidoreductase [Chloroflexi bacterium]|nr:FAD-dependent oxidoreductase [Chloroflexota bacterium]
MYDLIILGGGPAGLTAAAYALHKRLETLVITQDLGGKTSLRFHAPWLEGHELLSGVELVNRFKSQLEYLEFVHELDRAVQVVRNDRTFSVRTEKQKQFEARALIVATGTTAKRLAVPGERELLGRGISYSAVSHAPLFIDRQVALIGQGTRALYAAAELALVAKGLVLILPDPKDVEAPLAKKLAENPKVKVLSGFQISEIVERDRFITGIALRHNGTSRGFEIEGLFVEMGTTPNSQMVAGLVEFDAENRIVVNARMATNCPGLFAAGDVTNTVAEQVLVAIGDGAKAALNVYEYLLGRITV